MECHVDRAKLVTSQLRIERQVLHGQKYARSFEETLKQTMARVGEVNDWSEEMHKGVVYSVKTMPFYHDEADRVFDAFVCCSVRP